MKVDSPRLIKLWSRGRREQETASEDIAKYKGQEVKIPFHASILILAHFVEGDLREHRDWIKREPYHCHRHNVGKTRIDTDAQVISLKRSLNWIVVNERIVRKIGDDPTDDKDSKEYDVEN